MVLKLGDANFSGQPVLKMFPSCFLFFSFSIIYLFIF